MRRSWIALLLLSFASIFLGAAHAGDELWPLPDLPEALRAAERDGLNQIQARMDRQWSDPKVIEHDGFQRLLDEVRGTFAIETAYLWEIREAFGDDRL